MVRKYLWWYRVGRNIMKFKWIFGISKNYQKRYDLIYVTLCGVVVLIFKDWQAHGSVALCQTEENLDILWHVCYGLLWHSKTISFESKIYKNHLFIWYTIMPFLLFLFRFSLKYPRREKWPQFLYIVSINMIYAENPRK